MRYIVCSDMHGNLSRLEAILEHSKFSKMDVLIHAGDCCDIGPKTHEVMGVFEKHNSIVLVGNHEIAHLFQHQITPYDKILDYGDFNCIWNNWILEKKVRFIIEIEGVIISHAGISKSLYSSVYPYGENWVNLLNDDMRYSYMKGQRYGHLFYDDVLSPLWFRPYDYDDPAKVVQMFGHTPYQSLNGFAKTNKMLFPIDGYDPSGTVAYGVIEDGKAEVIKFAPENPIEMYSMRQRWS